MNFWNTLDTCFRRYVMGNDHRITTDQPALYIKKDMRGLAKNEFIEVVNTLCDTGNFKVSFLNIDSPQKITKMRVNQLPENAVCKGRFLTQTGRIYTFQ